ncbi:29687_t:CDS:2, partial [Gigaspora margarita]
MSETTYEVEYLKTRCKPNESRNAYIERISQNKIINFICWDKIEKVEYLRTGGSAIINKAEWIEKRMTVVLKTVTENINSVNDEFIQEIKVFHNIELVLSNAENKEKAPIVGYENLYLVFEYAELGDLRDYLSHNTLNWELKVNIARQTTCGLYFLHKNGILHCDLHTKNVVIQKNGDGIRAIITDFGLSNVLPRNSKSNQQIAGCVYKSIHQEDIITGEKWKQTSQRSSKKKHAFNDILEQLSTKDLEMIRHDP